MGSVPLATANPAPSLYTIATAVSAIVPVLSSSALQKSGLRIAPHRIIILRWGAICIIHFQRASFVLPVCCPLELPAVRQAVRHRLPLPLRAAQWQKRPRKTALSSDCPLHPSACVPLAAIFHNRHPPRRLQSPLPMARHQISLKWIDRFSCCSSAGLCLHSHQYTADAPHSHLLPFVPPPSVFATHLFHYNSIRAYLQESVAPKMR